MGVLLGESGFGIQFHDAELAHALGFGALMLILAEGGLTTPWPKIRPVIRMGLSLATIGVAVSVAIVAVGAHYLLGLRWEVAVLLGAITSPTDAAAVFSVLRRVPLPSRVIGTLEAESGLNDAPTVVLVTVVSAGAAHQSVLQFLGIVLGELVLGVVVGLAVGYGGVQLMRRAALPASGLYPLAVLSLAILAYAGASILHGSGFAAVYVAALVLGNADLPHRAATRSFSEGIAWLAQIGLFVMLGLLVSPSRIDLTRRRARGGRRPDPDLRGPAGLGAGQLGRAADAGARAGVPVAGPGCAARCRSCWRRSRSRRGSPGRASCSTSSS